MWPDEPDVPPRLMSGVFVCAEPGGENRERAVHLDVKHGTDTKDYDKLAQAEKLKPLEKELRKLEDLSESIVNDFAYMRAREEEMRDTNGRPPPVDHSVSPAV